jgi:hypothetical protein
MTGPVRAGDWLHWNSHRSHVPVSYFVGPVAISQPTAFGPVSPMAAFSSVSMAPQATFGPISTLAVSPAQLGFGLASPVQYQQVQLQAPAIQTIGVVPAPMSTFFVQGSGAPGGSNLPVSPFGSGLGLSANSSMFADVSDPGNGGLLGSGSLAGADDDLLLRADPEYRMLSQQIGENHVRALKNELRARLRQELRSGNSNRNFRQWGGFLLKIALEYFREYGYSFLPGGGFIALIDRLILDVLREEGIRDRGDRNDNKNNHDDSRNNTNGGTLPPGTYRITGTIQLIDGDDRPIDPPGPTPPPGRDTIDPGSADRDVPAGP